MDPEQKYAVFIWFALAVFIVAMALIFGSCAGPHVPAAQEPFLWDSVAPAFWPAGTPYDSLRWANAPDTSLRTWRAAHGDSLKVCAYLYHADTLVGISPPYCPEPNGFALGGN